jgi:hypothetical protein
MIKIKNNTTNSLAQLNAFASLPEANLAKLYHCSAPSLNKNEQQEILVIQFESAFSLNSDRKWDNIRRAGNEWKIEIVDAEIVLKSPV